MFITLIYILPCFVCLMWMLSFSFQVKSQRQKVYMWSLAASLIYYLAFSTMARPDTEYSSLIHMDVLLLPAGLAMFSLHNVFVHMHLRGSRWSLSYLLWLAPSLCIAVAGLLMYGIIGFDNAIRVNQMYDQQGTLTAPYGDAIYSIYIMVSKWMFNAVAVALGIALTVQCVMLMRKEGYRLGDVSRFFFAHHRSTPGRVLATLLIAELLTLLPLITSPEVYDNVLAGIGQSLLIALIKHCQCHVVFFSDDSREVTLHALSHLQNSGQVDTSHKLNETTSATDTVSEAEAVREKGFASESEAAHEGLSRKMQVLSERLRELLEVEEIWRDDSLTIVTLAERLNVSRTTVSNMINAYYNQPARDLINHYRIEGVKRYLLDNPTATQEAVAACCGFKSASYLNSKFKEAVGTTPLLWLIEARRQ